MNRNDFLNPLNKLLKSSNSSNCPNTQPENLSWNLLLTVRVNGKVETPGLYGNWSKLKTSPILYPNPGSTISNDITLPPVPTTTSSAAPLPVPPLNANFLYGNGESIVIEGRSDEVYPVPGLTKVNEVTTPAVTDAVITASTPPPTPTLIVIVSVVTAVIVVVIPATGSVDLGYGWSDE